ncbi:hypothetical protein DOY81_001443 [Sarcophaga bullata]|nr:hypothetical protein DOY81_001443 [Sarcophaga bullata]
MISRIFLIFLITATVNSFNYDRQPKLVKNKIVDYRMSLRHFLRLPEVNQPPFNLFNSREEFVKLAEQNIKNYKPYDYTLYRPYNPSKPAFIYDRDYVTKVLSSLGLLRPLQTIPLNSRNTSQPVTTTATENLNNKVNSWTESPKPVNNSFATLESNGRESTTAANSNEDINTTTNSYTEQTTNAAVSKTENAERTTELITEGIEFSTHTAEATNIPNYYNTALVTDAYTEETINTTTDSYTTLSPNTEESSNVDEETIVQSSTDSFGIATTTDILSYSSTEPAANAETQYTTEISTTERIEPENGNLEFTNINHVETTTTSTKEEDVNPTSTDATAPTSTAEDAERTTELTTESFGLPTNAAQGTNIPNDFTTESVTESNRIGSTTDANTEETIYTTIDSYTILEDFSTANEETIAQFSTTSFGIATITDILSFSSTEPATTAKTQYTTKITITTDCIEPEDENLLFTDSNRAETITTSRTVEDIDPTSTDATTPITQFGNADDTERTTELTTESFGFPTNPAYVTNIPNNSATEYVTESNRIHQTTTNANTVGTINTTTDSYTTLAPNAEDYTTADKETITQFFTDSFDIATTTAMLSFSPTEPSTDTGTLYTTDISTTDYMETENDNLVFTNSNRVVTTTTSNTEGDISPTTDTYTEQTTDAAGFIIKTEYFPTLNALDAEKTTELTTPSVWTATNIVDATDILDYSTKEPVTSPEIATISLESDNGYLMFTESNQVETTTAKNTEQSIPTTTGSSTEQTVDNFTTLVPILTEEPITEITMEGWDIETTIKTTTESDIFTSTVNPIDAITSTIESLTTETNRMETITTANDNNDIRTTTSNYENHSNAYPTKTAHEIENYTTSGVVDVDSTTLEFDNETTSQICEETTETEDFPETIVQSESVTAGKFENVTSTTEATEISIDLTTELNEKTTVNILNGNTTEQEPFVFSTTDNFNLKDSIGTTTKISKEIESLADLLQPTTESYNEVSTQAFDSTSIKDVTESTTKVVLIEDITTEMYEESSTSALMDSSIIQNSLLSTITELPTLSTTEGNDEITTETSQIECLTEIIEQVEETTIKAETIGEKFEKSITELMLTEISGTETATEQILKNIIENDKGNATSRVLLTDATTASETVDNILETYNTIVPETFEQSKNQFMTNTTEFYKENTTKQIELSTPIPSEDNPTATSLRVIKVNADNEKLAIENRSIQEPIVTTEHLIDIKSTKVDNKSNEENSVTTSNQLENPSIEPLYNRQQKLAAAKKLNNESSKRKAKKFNYDTDVMPSLGDYDYI